MDAEFACFVLLEQVEGDAGEDGVVLRGVSGTFPAEILVKADIEHPVQFVFDTPVLTNDPVQPRCLALLRPSERT
jgi:hypothetical protein